MALLRIYLYDDSIVYGIVRRVSISGLYAAKHIIHMLTTNKEKCIFDFNEVQFLGDLAPQTKKSAFVSVCLTRA